MTLTGGIKRRIKRPTFRHYYLVYKCFRYFTWQFKHPEERSNAETSVVLYVVLYRHLESIKYILTFTRKTHLPGCPYDATWLLCMGWKIRCPYGSWWSSLTALCVFTDALCWLVRLVRLSDLTALYGLTDPLSWLILVCLDCSLYCRLADPLSWL